MKSPRRGAKYTRSIKNLQLSTNSSLCLGNGARQTRSFYMEGEQKVVCALSNTDMQADDLSDVSNHEGARRQLMTSYSRLVT